jgi:hypothetical protein
MTFQQEASHDPEAGQIAHESGSEQPKDAAWLIDVLDEAITAEDWRRIFRRLLRSKSVRAKLLLVQYRFGRIGPARRID